MRLLVDDGRRDVTGAVWGSSWPGAGLARAWRGRRQRPVGSGHTAAGQRLYSSWAAAIGSGHIAGQQLYSSWAAAIYTYILYIFIYVYICKCTYKVIDAILLYSSWAAAAQQLSSSCITVGQQLHGSSAAAI